jgi:hypothetical protein
VGRGGLKGDALTAEYVTREVRELARRWDEEGEREAPLAARWKKLRAALDACPEEAYAAAREAGAEVLARAPIGLKTAVVATFPREGEWAAEVARELLATQPPPKWGVRVLGSIADAEVAKELASALVVFGAWPVVACAPEMVATMGDAAADVLIALAPYASETRDRNALLHAVALVKSEKVAEWLSQQLGDTIGLRVAAKFFRETPELARVLEPSAKKRTSAGRAAKALMAFSVEESPASRVAPMDEVPEILRAPPWRTGAMKKAGGVVECNVIALSDPTAKATWAAKIDWVPYAQVASSTCAWAIVHAYFERPAVRDVVREWLSALPTIAAVGLVPIAVGEDARRRNACRALRMLRDSGHAAEVDDAASKYGDAVSRAVAVALSPDPRLDAPLKPPSLPKNIALGGLPQPRLRSGAALPADAVRNLAELLAIASDLVPYVGVDEVARACDPRSLEAFSWGFFEAWLGTGSSTKSPWPLFALGIFGADPVARELGPRLRGWAQQGKNVLAASAVRVLEVIALRGSDVAVVQLVNTASGARSDDVKDRAEAALHVVAKARGLDLEQLADRAAPAIEDLTLDLGARPLTASIEASGNVVLRDATGAAIDALRATKDDDPNLFEAAKERHRALKADAQEVYRAQTRRFETALRESRWWSREDFEGVVLQKRVLFDIARRLVWSAHDASGARLATFRVVEDRTYADSEDRHAGLASAARFKLLHPLESNEGELASWGAIFGDYELVQPFSQIGREVFALTPEEAASHQTQRFSQLHFDASRVYALEHRGWSRDGGDVLTIGAGGALVVHFAVAPGLYAPPPLPPQRIAAFGVSSRDRGARAPMLGDVDRIRMSEILRDVTALAG